MIAAGPADESEPAVEHDTPAVCPSGQLGVAPVGVSPSGLLVRPYADNALFPKEDEMKYVLAFRGQVGRDLTAEQVSQWPTWFEQIKDSIADFGSRVGDVRGLGVAESDGRSDALSGYIVINADSLDDAATLAAGCPALQQGGGVEVGEHVAA